MKRVVDTGRPLTRAELFELVEFQVEEDGWSELLVVDVCGSPDGERSYLFVAKGSDRRLDVEDVQQYCGLQQEISVAGDFPLVVQRKRATSSQPSVQTERWMSRISLRITLH